MNKTDTLSLSRAELARRAALPVEDCFVFDALGGFLEARRDAIAIAAESLGTIDHGPFSGLPRIVLAFALPEGFDAATHVALHPHPDGTWNVREKTEEEVKGPVPAEVSPYQFRTALVRAGFKLADIDALVHQAGDEAVVAWEYALGIIRAYPLIAALGSVLRVTDEQIDDIFRAAAQIE